MMTPKKRLLFAALLLAAFCLFSAAACAEILSGDHAYISSMAVSDISTGSAPFDTDDTPGNDSSDKNTIVRSFDTVTYRLNLTLASHNTASSDGNQFEKARIYFAFKIPYTASQAQFNTTSMAWMETGFRVEETADGQILYCSILKDESPNYAVPGTQSVFVSLDIKNLKNGEIVVPEFYACMEGNQVFDDQGKLVLAQNTCPDHNQKELYKVTANPVTVSAKLKLNVKLGSFTNAYNAKYDFSSGNGDNSPYPAMNRDKGVLKGSGVSISAGIAIVNDSVSKGMRGVELPDGSPITFDIQLDTVYKLNNQNTTVPVKGEKDGVAYDFSPLIYSYGGCTYDFVNDDGRTVGQRPSMPTNVRKNSSYLLYACCNGGLVQVEQEGNVLHLTITGYEIDDTFPRRISPIAITDEFTANIGYFTTSEFHFFMPHYNQNGGTEGSTEDYIAQMFGAGTFVFNISAGNLRAKSQSASLPDPDDSMAQPDVTNQVYQNDDKRTANVYLTNPGVYNTVCAFANKKGTNQYYPLTPDCFYDGRDWTFADTEVAITSGVWSVGSKGDDFNRMVAFDDFLKIDTDALEFVDRLKGSTSSNNPGLISSAYDAATAIPDGIVDFRQTSMKLGGGQKIQIMYAVKKDGTGWLSDDEMRQTTQESSNLVWYDRLNTAKANGKVVGLLFQYRGLTDPDTIYPRYQVLAHVRPDAEPDNTYMITHELRIWNVESLATLGHTPPASVSEEYTWFNDKIPLLTASSNSYQNELSKYLDACCAHFNQRYDRLVYNADGSTTGGTTSYYYGDTVYVAPYSTQIDINVVNGASSADSSVVFDMGAEQNVADFALSPVVSLPEISNSAIENTKCDTITITQTLPAGLSYIPGSSVYGGTYVSAALHGRQGTVVADENGFVLPLQDDGSTTFNFTLGNTQFPITVRLNVSRDASGQTTLEYVFEGVPMAAAANGQNALSKLIHFSTEIEPNTVANWTLQESVTIHGETEKTKLAEGNGNIATTSILVYQNTAEGIGVRADRLYNEQDASLGWTISYTNASNMPRSDALLFARMPQDRHTGTYSWTEWTLDLQELGTDGSDLELWYTTADVADKNASHYTRDQLSANGFAKLELTKVDGKLVVPSIPAAAQNATAWVLTGSIGAQKTYSIHHTIKPTGNIPSDSYRTTAYFRADNNAPHSYATVYIVGRELSGLVWYDENYNGIREADESLISGVTAELYKGSEKVTHDVTGAALAAAVTGADGAYVFAKLPEGEYTVRFSNLPGIYTGVTRYQAVGADDSLNSDAQTTGGVTQTTPAVKLASADEIARNYTQHSPHIDLGLIRTGEIGVEKTVTGDLSEAEANRAFSFTLTLTFDGAPYTQPLLSGNTTVTPTAAGTVSFTLKHGETASFSGIPVGAAYTVTEAAVPHYTSAFTNASGVISDTKASAVCVNHYQPDAAVFAPSVTKALAGQTPPADAAFTFTLAHTGGDANGLTLPQNLQATVNGTGTVQFGDITFSKAGTYTFSITEEATAVPGYTNDENGAWTLKVTVTDQNGTLNAMPAYERGNQTSAAAATFTNTYMPDPDEYAIVVTKLIEGVSYGSETYTFELLAPDGAGEAFRMPLSSRASVTGAGSAAFAPITFLEPGEYVFLVREIPGETENCIYDTSDLTVFITVSDLGGSLAVTHVTYEKNGAASLPEFVNTYRTGQLSLTKTVQENNADLSREWHFVITLKDTAGNAFPYPLAYDGSASGTVSSGGTLTLTHGQTITIRNIPEGLLYEVTETEANTDRYTTTAVDPTGEIVSSATAAVSFTNTFTPYPVEYPITVTKRIEGSPAEEETYFFRLTDAENRQDCYTMPCSSEASVTGAGTAAFDPITFHTAGQYRFLVHEIAGDTENCTYDDSTLAVTLTVANINGQLTVTGAGYDKNGTPCEPVFVNAYQAGSLTIAKTVEGNAGEIYRPWNFIVKLMYSDGRDYTTALPYDGSVTGTITSGDILTLRHGEWATIHSIPEGILYIVTEIEADTDGYTTVATHNAGFIENGETALAGFTNTRIKADVPQTGDRTPLMLLCLLFVFSLAAAPLLCKKPGKR